MRQSRNITIYDWEVDVTGGGRYTEDSTKPPAPMDLIESKWILGKRSCGKDMSMCRGPGGQEERKQLLLAGLTRHVYL